MDIAIIDYGMGNIHSIQKKIKQLGVNAIVTSDYDTIANAKKIILPGVGHFTKAMNNLKQLNLIDIINEKVLVQKTPILGICLGMQLMATESEEGDGKGFGWFDAQIVRFKVNDSLLYKVPHTGWNQIINKKKSNLTLNVPDNSEFYFVHAYHIKLNDVNDALHETDYEYTFVSAIEKENIVGVQYHPEKSHKIGDAMFQNFIEQY